MVPDKTLRIFADHYQFFIYDGDKNPFEPLPNYSDQSVARGWTRTASAISFRTRAHLNDHRLDMFLAKPPSALNCERSTIHPINISSGSLALHDTEETALAELIPGPYTLVLAAYNLGVEPSPEDPELSDTQFLTRLDWERYELYVFPAIEQAIDGPYPQVQ